MVVLAAIESYAGVGTMMPWGSDGHRIVCAIAWRNMTPRTKEAVQQLLDSDTDSLRYHRFEEACLWADEVRYKDERYDRFKTAHYVNTPRGEGGVDTTRDCAGSLCVVEAVVEQRAILADATQPTKTRLEALKWVSHFVGDIHQPLHVWGEDKGGNEIEVILNGQPTSLHGVWDYGLIAQTGLEWGRYARVLGHDISAVQRRMWSSPDPVEWADESYSICEDTIYQFPIGSDVKDEYYYRNIQTVERQLKKAGIRLANLLNGMFDA